MRALACLGVSSYWGTVGYVARNTRESNPGQMPSIASLVNSLFAEDSRREKCKSAGRGDVRRNTSHCSTSSYNQMPARCQSSQNKPKPRHLESNRNMTSQPLKTFELCPKGWSFPSQGVLPNLEMKLPTVNVTWGFSREIRIRHLNSWELCGSPWASSFITSVKRFKVPNCLIVSHSGAIVLLVLTYVMYVPKNRPLELIKYFPFFYKFDNTKTQKNVGKFQQGRHRQTPTPMHR